MPTVMDQGASNSADPRSGCWLNYDPAMIADAYSPTYQSLRKLDMIKDGSVIMGDQSYMTVSTNFNQCMRANPWNCGRFAVSGAPGWNHRLASNFLFKDGHLRAFAYAGGAQFDSDYLAKR